MYLYETSKIAFFQYFLKIMWDYLNLLLLLFFPLHQPILLLEVNFNGEKIPLCGTEYISSKKVEHRIRYNGHRKNTNILNFIHK